MEDNQLLKARRKCPIQISWKGNEQCFHKYVDNIQNALGKGNVTWKRNEKLVNTQFELKLVKYSEDIVWQNEEVSYCESVAFVHLYFIYVSTVDEYKNHDRFDVVEWFAQLNKAQNSQWLIIFDSTKARERKNRGSILEKIKSDFSRYQEKLIEVCDGNIESLSDMGQKINSMFATSLDKFLNNYEKSYAELKGNWESDEWNLTVFINQQFNLCRFFWNLSMYDAVSLELDKIDGFISEIINNSIDNRPRWLEVMKEQGLGETCPLMRLLTHVEGAPENVSLIELRTFILANQVLSYIFIYNSRKKKSLSPLSPRRADVLQNDFANILLKCASSTIQNLRNEIFELNIKHNNVLLYIWISLIITDIIELVEELFVTIDDISQDQNVLCHLTNLKCNSLYEVYRCKASSKNSVKPWLKATVAQRNADILGIKTAELLNVLRRTFLERNDLEGSPDQGKTIEELIDVVLIKGINILKGFHWDKAACELMKYRFDIYRSLDDIKTSKTIYFKLLECLFQTCPLVDLLIYYCKLGFEMFLNDIKKDRKLMINMLLLLITKNNNIEEKTKYSEILLKESLKNVEHLRIYNFMSDIPISFPFLIKKVSGPFIVSLLNEPISFKILVENNFYFILQNCKVKAIFKKLTKTSTEPLNPLFTCLVNDADNSRCTVKAKGLTSKKDYKTILKESVDTIEDDTPIFITNEVDLIPGTNDLELSMIANEVGLFALNHFEVNVGNSLTFVLNYQQSIADFPSLDNVHLMIDLRLPNIELESKPETLLAGIAQEISLKIRAGTNEINEETKLKLTYKNEYKIMEFLTENNKWKNELFLDVPKLKSHENTIVNLMLILPIDQMHYSAEENVLTTRQLQVEWLDKKWLIDLEFLPIMTMKMSTTIIEERVLFSLDISRSDLFDFLDINIMEAKLEQKQSITKPPILAKLINPSLQLIEAHSSHRIVWELPQSNIDKSIPLKHYLNIKYKPKENKKKKTDNKKCYIPELAFSREYNFIWEQEIAISKAEYYICAQIVSGEHTSSCRLNQECSLVVSLKQLSNHSDAKIVVTVDADSTYWSVPTRCMIVNMKESGIGRTEFVLIPKQTGYLPCPSVYIHQCNPDYNDKDPIIEAKVLGERLSSYHRLQGKQMWVIPTKVGSEDTLSQTPSTTSIRAAMKKAFKSVASKIDREKE